MCNVLCSSVGQVAVLRPCLLSLCLVKQAASAAVLSSLQTICWGHRDCADTRVPVLQRCRVRLSITPQAAHQQLLLGLQLFLMSKETAVLRCAVCQWQPQLPASAYTITYWPGACCCVLHSDYGALGVLNSGQG